MPDISAVDKERLVHINLLMDEFHTHIANIYECLVDREVEDCSVEVNSFINKLKHLKKSLEDDV